MEDWSGAKSPNSYIVNTSPGSAQHRKKYEIENHSYLGIRGASLFAGVLQRDEAGLLRAKRLHMQQEVKAALQLQMQEKQRRLEAERGQLEGQSLICANPQAAEPAANIDLLYQELISEHEKLRAKVAAQGVWIRHLVDRSCREMTKGGKPGGSVNPRRTHSSAAGLPPEQLRPTKDLSLLLDDSQDEALPVTSFATPVHNRIGKQTFEGESVFLYPGRKCSFQQSKPHRLTPDPAGRRETSEPRQRRTPTPNLRFPKDVFPMAVRRRPALV